MDHEFKALSSYIESVRVPIRWRRALVGKEEYSVWEKLLIFKDGSHMLHASLTNIYPDQGPYKFHRFAFEQPLNRLELIAVQSPLVGMTYFHGVSWEQVYGDSTSAPMPDRIIVQYSQAARDDPFICDMLGLNEEGKDYDIGTLSMMMHYIKNMVDYIS